MSHRYLTPWSFVLLAMLLAAGGCARGGQGGAPADEPLVFFDPGDSPVRRELLTFTGSGGAVLGYFHYRPAGRPRDIAIVYLNGIESHAGWFEGPAYLLAQRGYDVYCLDRRGSGINREGRGFASGDAESHRVLIEDVHAFFKLIGPRTKILAGLSWGGKLATACALAHREDADALVLIAPGLITQVDLGPLEKIRLGMALLVHPGARFKIPIEPRMFTSDPDWQARIERDPLRLREATARFLFESRRLDGRIAKSIGQNRVPILLLLAGRDRIVDNEAIVALLGRGKQSLLTVRRYRSRDHSLQFEAPGSLVADIDRWIAQTGEIRHDTDR